MNQHIIPKVYLKQFGFTKYNKLNGIISVNNLEKNNWEYRDIEKFLSKKDIYNLDYYDETFKLIIENNLNGEIESRLPKIIKQLDNEEKLTKNIHLAIAETTSNFLCRNYPLREWISSLLVTNKQRDFFDLITEMNKQDKNLSNLIFDRLNAISLKDRINSYMVLYMNYVSFVLTQTSIEIIKGNDLVFFTSDNPVILTNNIGYGQIEKEESQIFFPISKKYLVKFYWNHANSIIQRTTINVNEDIYNYYHKKLLPNSVISFIIAPFDHATYEL